MNRPNTSDRKKGKPWVLLLILLITGLFGACRDKEPGELHKISLLGETMGTSYSVTCLLPPGMDEEQVLHGEILGLFREVDQQLSNWNTDSWVSRFNHMKKGEELPCPPHASAMLELSLELARRTDGALDPTVSPLVELWGFGASPGSPQVPDEDQIRQTLERCGYQKLDFDSSKRTVSKQVDGLELNFSSIAKGYTVDLVADFLDKSGIENHLVDIGGEIRAKGLRSDRTPWTIGIADPLRDHGLSSVRFTMTQGAVATSGDSERFFEHKGHHYSHIVDPRTGTPVKGNIRSVSITAETCALADGLATACFLLGSEKGLELIESFPGVEGLFLFSDQAPVPTAGWNH